LIASSGDWHWSTCAADIPNAGVNILRIWPHASSSLENILLRQSIAEASWSELGGLVLLGIDVASLSIGIQRLAWSLTLVQCDGVLLYSGASWPGLSRGRCVGLELISCLVQTQHLSILP